MDLVKFSDTGGFVDYAEEAIATSGFEPSMEDIVESMRSHLFGRNRSSVNKFVYACSRGNGVRHARQTNVDTSDKYICPENSTHLPLHLECNHKGTHNEDEDTFTPHSCNKTKPKGKGRASCHNHSQARQHEKARGISHIANGVTKTDEETMLDADDADYEMLNAAQHPRLMTPFYLDLRKRYPQAFCRRSSSIRSDHDTPIVNGDGDLSDPSVTECRHHQRHTAKKSNGILKNHSSVMSLCSEAEADVCKDRVLPAECGVTADVNGGSITNGGGVSRSDSTLSLRERRLKNQQSMRSLLAERPFRISKKSSDTETDNCDQKRLHKVVNGHGDSEVLKSLGPTMCTDSPHMYTNHDTYDGHDALPPDRCRSPTKDILVTSHKQIQDALSQPQLNGKTSSAEDKCQQFEQLNCVAPNKDSDGDSGIANGSRQDSGENISQSLKTPKTERTRSNTGYCFEMPTPLPCAARRHLVRRTSSTASGPLKADHNIQTTQTSSHKYSVLTKDNIHRGARPKVNHKVKHHGDRPSSADARPHGVRFEDEVSNLRPLNRKQRSMSQPLLDSAEQCTGKHDDMLQRFRSDDQLSQPPTSGQPGSTSDMVAALEDTHLESSMQIHRASPVVVMPTNSQRHHHKSLLTSLHSRTPTQLSADSQLSSPSLSLRCGSPSPGVATDVALFSDLMAGDSERRKKKKKKNRLPWQKNRDRFTPTNDIELMQTKFHSGMVSPPNGWAANRSAGSGSEGYDSTHGSENAYESIDTLASKTTVVAAICEAGKQNEERSEGCQKMATTTAVDSSVTYAQVNKAKTRKPPSPMSSPSVSTLADDEIESIPGPPLPQRLYERELAASRSSLVDGIKMSAKRTFSRLRKAVSLDRLDRRDDHSDRHSSPLSPKKKSPSLLSLKGKLSFGKNDKESSERTRSFSKSHMKQSSSLSSLPRAETPNRFQPIGKLVSLNADGTQMIELTRPHSGPFGFYIARGNAKYNHAIFVSRLSDSLPSHCLSGLLSIGDEIQEINGDPVAKLRLDVVYEMMAKTDKLLLKTLPFVART